MSIVYFEGAFLPEEEVKLPITDRGFLFGDGAYATIRVHEGISYFLERHLERLKAQTNSMRLSMPSLHPETVAELIELNDAKEGTWRLKIVVSGGDLPDYCLPPRTGRVLAFLTPYVHAPFHPLKLGIFSYPFSVCHASFKSLAHLNRFYVMEEALQRGFDDCITLTESGIILEAAFGNLFWVEGRTLYTPDPKLPLYFGVTIEKVIECAEDLGFSVEKVKTPLEEIPQEAHYFRTNSMGGIREVAQISSMPCLVDETLTKRFQEAYAQKAFKASHLALMH